MKDTLGIEVCCENCEHLFDCYVVDLCEDSDYLRFYPTTKVLKQRVIELQKQVFTKEEAEKVETFLTHGYQMMINENKEIFLKIEKMKGE